MMCCFTLTKLCFMYFLHFILGVPLSSARILKKCTENLVKKDSGMWGLFLYISFIILIKCEWEKDSGIFHYLTIYGIFQLRLLKWDTQK